MPAPGTEPAGLVAPEPWKGETGPQCPGRAAASSCPLWAWLVGSELRACCKPRTQRTAGHLPRGPSCHAPVGPLVSPHPSCPPQGPSQLLRGAKWPGYPLPHHSPSTCRPSYRDRRASPGRRAPWTCLEPRRQPWPLGTGSRRLASTSLGMGSPVRVRPWLCWLEDQVVSGSPVPSPCPGTPSPVPPRFRGS